MSYSLTTAKAKKQKTLQGLTQEPKKKSIKLLLDEDSDDESKQKTAADVVQDASEQQNPSKDVNKTAQQEQNDKRWKTGYVLFIGNLPYKATTDDIKQHFEEIGCRIKAVRLITDKDTQKPRGFAYLDLLDNKSLRLALGLDKSEVLGRQINVEFTTIGGKSGKRLQKLKEKNSRLKQFKQLPGVRSKQLGPGQPRPFDRGVGNKKFKKTVDSNKSTASDGAKSTKKQMHSSKRSKFQGKSKTDRRPYKKQKQTKKQPV